MSILRSDRWLIPIAFATIYLVWGSTYLANWVAIQDMPPFLMSGSRFFAAGAVLYLLSLAFETSKPNRQQVKNGIWMGILFLAVGTGGIVWAMQWVSSGIAALMVAFQPLLIVLMMWRLQGKRPALQTLLGTALGMAGMAFLVGQDQFISDRETLAGVGVIFISIFSWGYASMKVAQTAMPQSKMQSAGIQMMGGGAALLLVSLFSGEMLGFQVGAMTAKGVGAWLYLVFLGSIVAYSAFNYLLVKSTPDKVATSNYVNPVVALFLGWWLNSELVTGQSLVAAVLMIAGVVFIKTRFSFLKKVRLTRREGLSLEMLALQMPGAVKEIDIQHFACSDAPLSSVIARIWHGVTPVEKAAGYVEWAKSKVAPDFESMPGNLGYTLLRRDEGERAHMTVISYWKDFEAVKQFAGEDYGKARIFPEEKKYLVEFEEEVEHKTVKA